MRYVVIFLVSFGLLLTGFFLGYDTGRREVLEDWDAALRKQDAKVNKAIDHLDAAVHQSMQSPAPYISTSGTATLVMSGLERWIDHKWLLVALSANSNDLADHESHFIDSTWRVKDYTGKVVACSKDVDQETGEVKK